MKFNGEEVHLPDDFDIEECKRSISEDMESILKTTPEAAPVLEEIAKLLAMAEEPEKYMKCADVSIEGFGSYELIAAPAPGMPGFSVLAKLKLENGKHDIGPAQVWHGDTMERAIQELEFLKGYYEYKQPTKLIDVVTGCIYDENGYFTPYDAEVPDLGPFAPLLGALDIGHFDFDDDEEDIEDD